MRMSIDEQQKRIDHITRRMFGIINDLKLAQSIGLLNDESAGNRIMDNAIRRMIDSIDMLNEAVRGNIAFFLGSLAKAIGEAERKISELETNDDLFYVFDREHQGNTKELKDYRKRSRDGHDSYANFQVWEISMDCTPENYEKILFQSHRYEAARRRLMKLFNSCPVPELMYLFMHSISLRTQDETPPIFFRDVALQAISKLGKEIGHDYWFDHSKVTQKVIDKYNELAEWFKEVWRVTAVAIWASNIRWAYRSELLCHTMFFHPHASGSEVSLEGMGFFRSGHTVFWDLARDSYGCGHAGYFFLNTEERLDNHTLGIFDRGDGLLMAYAYAALRARSWHDLNPPMMPGDHPDFAPITNNDVAIEYLRQKVFRSSSFPSDFEKFCKLFWSLNDISFSIRESRFLLKNGFSYGSVHQYIDNVAKTISPLSKFLLRVQDLHRRAGVRAAAGLEEWGVYGHIPNTHVTVYHKLIREDFPPGEFVPEITHNHVTCRLGLTPSFAPSVLSLSTSEWTRRPPPIIPTLKEHFNSVFSACGFHKMSDRRSMLKGYVIANGLPFIPRTTWDPNHYNDYDSFVRSRLLPPGEIERRRVLWIAPRDWEFLRELNHLVSYGYLCLDDEWLRKIVIPDEGKRLSTYNTFIPNAIRALNNVRTDSSDLYTDAVLKIMLASCDVWHFKTDEMIFIGDNFVEMMWDFLNLPLRVLENPFHVVLFNALGNFIETMKRTDPEFKNKSIQSMNDLLKQGINTLMEQITAFGLVAAGAIGVAAGIAAGIFAGASAVGPVGSVVGAVAAAVVLLLTWLANELGLVKQGNPLVPHPFVFRTGNVQTASAQGEMCKLAFDPNEPIDSFTGRAKDMYAAAERVIERYKDDVAGAISNFTRDLHREYARQLFGDPPQIPPPDPPKPPTKTVRKRSKLIPLLLVGALSAGLAVAASKK